jgi:SAM-dependent methyltransferase
MIIPRRGTSCLTEERVGFRAHLSRNQSKIGTDSLMRNCPVCHGEQGEILHSQRLVVMDDYPLPPSFDVVQCSACGMVFNRNSATQKDYDSFYERFSVHQNPAESADGDIPVWEVTRLQNLTEITANSAPSKGSRILDVGCSSGGLLKNLVFRGFSNVVGVDPSPVCVAHVRAKGIEAYQGGAGDLPENIGTFDLITLTGVLEHIEDVHATIASLVRLCSPAGRILVEVPDAIRYADFLHSPFQDFNTEHINHFSIESLCNLMRQFGMERFREDRIEISGPSGLQLPCLLAGFERVQEQPMNGPWMINKSFRHSMQRYVNGSREIMERLNQQVLHVLTTSPEVLVWGTGQLAMKMLSDTALRDAKIIAFVDANPIHSGRSIMGRPILLPQKIPQGDWPIIVTSLLHADGILRVIRNLDLANPVFVLQAQQQPGSSLHPIVRQIP